MTIVGKHLEEFAINEAIDSIELKIDGAVLKDVEMNNWYYNYEDSTLTCKALDLTLVAVSIPHAADVIKEYLDEN